MAELVLGPLLRHTGLHDAVVWVETAAPCEVEVLGARSRTFCVGGHHFALVVVEGLEPGSATPYEVALDGRRVWPPENSKLPPSLIRTLPGDETRIAFASCRAAAPHEPPYTLSPDDHPLGHGVDALQAYAHRMLACPPEEWPHLLVFLGDQVYVDELAPEARARIRRLRDTTQPPGDDASNFEEYALLYREAWGDPITRWVLSTVSSAMVWDDHEVHDDWNTSQSWLDEIRREPWWEERIAGAVATYWLYQHLGNLSPQLLAESDLLRQILEAEDGYELLHEFGIRADREVEGVLWSFERDLGHSRLITVDSRGGRVLDGTREMVDDSEWDWIVERATGDLDHLLVATSLPFLLPPGAHGLEAWSEAVAAGAWGRALERLGEKARRALDLEHWAAFGSSFEKLARLLTDVADGRRGAAPASVLVLSGDVHYSYLASIERDGTPILQATCSPLRNPIDRKMRLVGRFAASRAGTAVGTALARLGRVPEPEIDWRVERGPWFDNVIASLDLRGREARLRIEKTLPDDGAEPRLELVFERRLA
jgi:PhoD-like phosphatase